MDRLPNNSWTRQAMVLDEEHVQMIQEAQDKGATDPQATGPQLSEYSPAVARLDQVVDRLAALELTILRANGANRLPKFKPQPRPQTAFEKVSARRRSAQHQRVVARVNASRLANRAAEDVAREVRLKDPTGISVLDSTEIQRSGPSAG